MDTVAGCMLCNRTTDPLTIQHHDSYTYLMHSYFFWI